MSKDFSLILQRCSLAFELDDENKNYDEAVNIVFRAYPTNSSLDHVLIKVTVLNSLYRTNIFQIHRLSKHVLRMEESKQLDEKLRVGDLEAIELLRKGHGIKRKSDVISCDLLSFATKYCHWHQPDYYPIYDSKVECAIRWLTRKTKLATEIEGDNLYIIQNFKSVMEELQRYRCASELEGL
jgi:hypothetical protein